MRHTRLPGIPILRKPNVNYRRKDALNLTQDIIATVRQKQQCFELHRDDFNPHAPEHILHPLITIIGLVFATISEIPAPDATLTTFAASL